MLGPLVGTLFVMGWWLMLSRAPRRDRWLGLAVFIGAGALAYPFMDHTLNLFGVLIVMLPDGVSDVPAGTPVVDASGNVVGVARSLRSC